MSSRGGPAPQRGSGSKALSATVATVIAVLSAVIGAGEITVGWLAGFTAALSLLGFVVTEAATTPRGEGGKWLWTAVALLASLLAGVLVHTSSLLAPEPAGRIDEPSGATLPAHVLDMTGTVQDLPADSIVWIVVYEAEIYWPMKSVTMHGDGTWSAPEVYVGQETDEVGTRYDVVLVLSPDAVTEHDLSAKAGLEMLLDVSPRIIEPNILHRVGFTKGRATYAG